MSHSYMNFGKLLLTLKVMGSFIYCTSRGSKDVFRLRHLILIIQKAREERAFVLNFQKGPKMVLKVKLSKILILLTVKFSVLLLYIAIQIFGGESLPNARVNVHCCKKLIGFGNLNVINRLLTNYASWQDGQKQLR